jgi:predicted flap endonuclease-1-like 5' DNA nuclease
MAVSLLDIKGVGPTLARLLSEAGFADPSAIASADTQELTNIAGIGGRSAVVIQEDAIRLLTETGPVDAAEEDTTDSTRKAKKLRKQAKQLRKQAKLLTKRAEKTKSKKKRKRRLREAAKLEATAKRKRRKAKKLLGG